MDTFQRERERERERESWCSCGWLSITPSFSQRFIDHRNHWITYTRFHLIVLRPFPSLLLSMSLITKTLKDSQDFCPHFKLRSFFIKLRIEKIISYYQPILRLKFRPRRNQVNYLTWQSDWKIPVEELHFQ